LVREKIMPSGVFPRSKKHRDNISRALTGRIRSEEERITMRKSKNLSPASRKLRIKIGKEHARNNGWFQRRSIKAFIDKEGYWCIYKKVEDGTTRKIRVHRLIAEKALKRKLRKGEFVHHVNMITMDNHHKNLLICNNGYHRQLHSKMSKGYAMEHFV